MSDDGMNQRMKPKLRINFEDFWKSFKKTDNYFYHLLSREYDVEICENPDFLIHSKFGKRHRNYKCVTIFFTGENRRPDLNKYDYAFTFDYLDDPRHYRLPLYVFYGDPQVLVRTADFDVEAVLREKTGFCSFVVSNVDSKFRIRFFDQLSKYKTVSSGGRVRNNVGGRVANKAAFVRQHKFNIAFENGSYPGYTTEKIFEPMLVNTIPIYWGNELVHRDFNPKSFVNYFDHGSLDSLVERVIEIDRDDDLFRQYLTQPCFHGNELNEFVKPENVLAQFHRIFNTDIQPVALRRKRFFFF
jgi:hypothetical protein